MPVFINEIANTYRLQVINLFEALGGKELNKRHLFYNDSNTDPKWKYNDGIHPNNLGYLEIAHTVASAWLGRDVTHRLRVRLRELNPDINTLMYFRSTKRNF